MFFLSCIAAVADVFVNEPSADWEGHAQRMLNVQSPSSQAAIEADSAAETDSSVPAEVAAVRFFPRKKLAILKRKLAGENPVDILRDEIMDRGINFKSKDKEKWIELARGDDSSVRRRIERGGGRGGSGSGETSRGGGESNRGNGGTSSNEDVVLSASDQINVLIDLAIDKNILGRMYYGWESHV